jgi:uncharacterized UPF0146 family protein
MSWKCGVIGYGILQKIFGFHKWHMTPVEQRPYGMEIIKWCNRLLARGIGANSGKVIEVGCGLGDIVAKIKTKNSNKVGYDIDEKVIKAAKIIHPGIKFQVDSFAPDIRGERILIFIAVNFLYALDSKTVKKEFKKLLTDNDVKYIITETMYPITPNYPNSHDMDKVLGSDYTCIKKRGFPAAEHSRRYILLYEKRGKNSERQGHI